MILTRIIEKFPLNFEMEFHFDLKPPPNVELVFEFDIDDYEILNNQHSILFLKGEISYETPAKNIKVDTFSLYFSDINEIPEYQIPIYYGDMLKFIKLSCKSDFFVGDNDNAVDIHGIESIIEAPKTIERLDEISNRPTFDAEVDNTEKLKIMTDIYKMVTNYDIITYSV